MNDHSKEASSSAFSSSLEQRAEQLLAKITSGPWAWEWVAEKSNEWAVGQAWDEDGKPIVGQIPSSEWLEDTIIERRLVGMNESGHANAADAEFIAAAPQLVRDLLSALQSAAHRQDAREICICAAIKLPNGEVWRGHRHDSAIQTAMRAPDVEKEAIYAAEQGFITSRNRFVSREEGARLQRKAGIVSASTLRPVNDMLFSEDLYLRDWRDVDGGPVDLPEAGQPGKSGEQAELQSAAHRGRVEGLREAVEIVGSFRERPNVPTLGAIQAALELRASRAEGVSPPKPREAKPWVVVLTCCGRDNGQQRFTTQAEAESFRDAYTSGPGVHPNGYSAPEHSSGHKRSGVISFEGVSPEGE